MLAFALWKKIVLKHKIKNKLQLSLVNGAPQGTDSKVPRYRFVYNLEVKIHKKSKIEFSCYYASYFLLNNGKFTSISISFCV